MSGFAASTSWGHFDLELPAEIGVELAGGHCRERTVDRSCKSFYLFEELPCLRVVEENGTGCQEHAGKVSQVLAGVFPVILVGAGEHSVVHTPRLAVDDRRLDGNRDGASLALATSDELVEDQRSHADDQEAGDDVAGEGMATPPRSHRRIPEVSGNERH